MGKRIIYRLRFLKPVRLAFLCCLLAATACTGISLAPEKATNVDSVETEGQAIVLEFWHTYSDLEDAVFMEQVLPLFEELHPGIRIKAVRKDI